MILVFGAQEASVPKQLNQFIVVEILHLSFIEKAQINRIHNFTILALSIISGVNSVQNGQSVCQTHPIGFNVVHNQVIEVFVVLDAGGILENSN